MRFPPLSKVRALALFVLAAVSVAQAQIQPFPASRTALVMGAWNYSDPQFSELVGIEQDMDQMAAKLQELGFRVTVVKNPTLAQAKRAVDDFGAALKTHRGGGLFYFSGHGAEHEGKNYLIPIGTNIQTRRDLDDEALTANRVLGRMEESGAQVNLVFLDCCRNQMSKAGGGDGLAPMNAHGSLIGYATASGKFAFSTNEGSPYTKALLKHIGTPGISLTDMHTLVSAEVQQISTELGTDQRPGQYAELTGIFQLVPGSPGASPAATTPARTMAQVPPQAPPQQPQPQAPQPPARMPARAPAATAEMPGLHPVARPPFEARYAAARGDGWRIPTLKIVSTKANQVTDEKRWMADNNIESYRVDVGNPFMNRPTVMPTGIPATVEGGPMPLFGIRGQEASFMIYGRNFSEGNILLVATPEFGQITDLLDFSSYAQAPKVVPGDEDYVFQSTTWADVKEGVLYVAHRHNTYAKSSGNQNAYITALELAGKELLWRSQPLVANSSNFLVWDDAIICGYGFTAEKDYLYVLNRHTGQTVQKLLVKSGPEMLVRQGSRLLVRCYDTDYVLEAR